MSTSRSSTQNQDSRDGFFLIPVVDGQDAKALFRILRRFVEHPAYRWKFTYRYAKTLAHAYDEICRQVQLQHEDDPDLGDYVEGCVSTAIESIHDSASRHHDVEFRAMFNDALRIIARRDRFSAIIIYYFPLLLAEENSVLADHFRSDYVRLAEDIFLYEL